MFYFLNVPVNNSFLHYSYIYCICSFSSQFFVCIGQHFDMTPDRFTLENMFSMELHHYEDIAREIIGNAVKELSIEKGVKDVESVSFHIYENSIYNSTSNCWFTLLYLVGLGRLKCSGLRVSVPG